MQIEICIFNQDTSLAETFPVTDVTLLNVDTGMRKLSSEALLFRARRNGLLPPQIGTVYWVLEDPDGRLYLREVSSQAVVDSCVEKSTLLTAWLRGEPTSEVDENAAFSILLVRALPGLGVLEQFDLLIGQSAESALGETLARADFEP